MDELTGKSQELRGAVDLWAAIHDEAVSRGELLPQWMWDVWQEKFTDLNHAIGAGIAEQLRRAHL